MHQNLMSPSTNTPTAKPWRAQGELFERLKLQPLPLFKAGPEDEASITRH